MKKVLISFTIMMLLVSGCNFIIPKDEPTDIPTEAPLTTELPIENPTNTTELMPEPSETLAIEADKTEEPAVGGRGKERHYEEAGKFSYELIDGWTLQAFPGLNTKILMPGAELAAHGISLIFIREEYQGTTEAYAALGMENAKENLENFNPGDSSRFETKSGLTVLKQHATYTANEMNFDSIFYSIGDDAKPELPKLVVTFGKFPGVPEEVVVMVEALIKSIQFED